MRPVFCILFSIILLYGCKKESDPGPDYACDCQPNGKNIFSLIIHQATALFPYENENHRWGYIDQNGSVIYNASYADAYSFSNNRAMVVDDKYGVQFAGFIDPEGTLAVPAKFRLVSEPYYSSEGLVPMGDVKKFVFGYIDMTGQIVVPFQYDYTSEFSEGLAVVYKNNKAGVIDINGNIVVPIKYESVTAFSEGLALVFQVGEKRGYLTPQNQFKFQGDFIHGTIFMYGLAVVDDPKSQLFGFINTEGQFVIQPQFTAAYVFSEGLAAVQFNNKWGFIDLSGNFVIEPQFDDVQIGFCGGLAPVMKNSRWGYIDRSGSFIITPQFDYADIFYCDLAQVWFINGTVGYVNKSGGIVYRSTQTLKEKPHLTKIADALSKYNIHVGND